MWPTTLLHCANKRLFGLQNPQNCCIRWRGSLEALFSKQFSVDCDNKLFYLQFSLRKKKKKEEEEQVEEQAELD